LLEGLGEQRVLGEQWVVEYPREEQDVRPREELYTAIKARQYESDTSWIGLRYGKLYLHKLYGGTVRLRNRPIIILNMCESAQITPSLSQSFIAFGSCVTSLR
jgi:hypothetical protein